MVIFYLDAASPASLHKAIDWKLNGGRGFKSGLLAQKQQIGKCIEVSRGPLVKTLDRQINGLFIEAANPACLHKSIDW